METVNTTPTQHVSSSQTPVVPPLAAKTGDPSSRSRIHPLLIILLGVLAVVLFSITGYLLFATNTFTRTSYIPSPSPSSIPTIDINYSFINPYEVTLKADPSASSSSQVFVKNTISGEEELWTTVSNVYTDHYNPAQFVDNALYIIRRTGGNEGYINNPNWTDELWKYPKDSAGKKLYSERGLSFLVSQDGRYIAVTNNESVTILNGNSNVLKKIPSSQLTSNPENTSSVSLLTISPFDVFVGNMAGPALFGLSSIQFPSMNVLRYDISKLRVGTEYSINPVKNLLAYSDYPAIFDVDSATNFKNSGTPVILSVYGLESKLNTIIATSSALQFSPLWLNETTLEYNSSTGSGILEKTF